MSLIKRGFATVSAVGLVMLGAVFVEPAGAVVVPCGATITVNTTLTADVGPCPGEGIRVNANNVTLNLNGHRVFGNGIPGDDYGVYVTGRTGVRVINGTVSGFDTGIYLEFGGGHTVEGVRAIDNIGPLDGSGFFGEGIQIFESDNNVINRNQLIHNGTFGGITVFDAVGTRITNNVIANNNVIETDSVHHSEPFGKFQEDIGIFLVAFSIGATNNSVVTDNQVTGNGLDGISVGNRTTNSTVMRNSVTGNGFGQAPGEPFRDGAGIRVGALSSGNTVSFNSVINNAGDGIAAVNASSTQFRSNRSFGNDKGQNVSIANFDLFDAHPTCSTNTWAANQFGTKNRACIA